MSIVQPFPAMSSLFKSFPVTSSHFNPHPAISSHFQLFLAIASQFWKFPTISSYFQKLRVILTYFQLITDISSPYQPFPVMCSHFSHFQQFHALYCNFQKFLLNYILSFLIISSHIFLCIYITLRVKRGSGSLCEYKPVIKITMGGLFDLNCSLMRQLLFFNACPPPHPLARVVNHFDIISDQILIV